MTLQAQPAPTSTSVAQSSSASSDVPSVSTVGVVVRSSTTEAQPASISTSVNSDEHSVTQSSSTSNDVPGEVHFKHLSPCLLYTSPSPRD